MNKSAQGLIAIKDLLWALAIFISLIAVIFGLLFAAFTRNRGARQDRDLDLSSVIIVNEGTAQTIADTGSSQSTDSDFKLELRETADAGQTYLNNITFLVDSPLNDLTKQNLPAGHVWVSASGTMPIASINTGTIIHSDGSKVNPDIAAMVDKPAILLISIGNDSLTHVSEEAFIENYTELINSIHSRSPQTIIICCSLFPVEADYITPDGLTNEMVRIANDWVKKVCESTGSYYCDIASVVTVNGCLGSTYTDNGKVLNLAGQLAVLNYIKTHAIS